jgi:hypothetical protein
VCWAVRLDLSVCRAAVCWAVRLDLSVCRAAVCWAVRLDLLKGKVHRRTGHECPEAVRHGSTLSLTSAIYGGQRHVPAALAPG